MPRASRPTPRATAPPAALPPSPASPAAADLSRPLGAAIRRLRAAGGYAQERFADRIGIHRTAMSTLERGLTDAKLSTLARVAAGLGIPVSALLLEVEREADKSAGP